MKSSQSSDGLGRYEPPQAMIDAMTSIRKNVNFKRIIKFSFSVLLDMLEKSGETAIRRHSLDMQTIKGYVEVSKVLRAHPAESEIAKEACKILDIIINHNEDEQFADKLGELGEAENC